jgi:hypothetical protein
MPPWDAPILTGDHPLSGNAGINAPACMIVKWQPLYFDTDNGDRAAQLRHLCGRLPTVLIFPGFARLNGRGSVLAPIARCT